MILVQIGRLVIIISLNITILLHDLHDNIFFWVILVFDFVVILIVSMDLATSPFPLEVVGLEQIGIVAEDLEILPMVGDDVVYELVVALA